MSEKSNTMATKENRNRRITWTWKVSAWHRHRNYVTDICSLMLKCIKYNSFFTLSYTPCLIMTKQKTVCDNHAKCIEKKKLKWQKSSHICLNIHFNTCGFSSSFFFLNLEYILVLKLVMIHDFENILVQISHKSHVTTSTQNEREVDFLKR